MERYEHVFWGGHATSVDEWIKRSERQSLIQRLWKKDPTLWTNDAAAKKEIVERLGWLDAPAAIAALGKDLKAFAEEIRGEGVTKIVLLGMGGSSLAPELFARAFGSQEGYPELAVLDSTDPGRIHDVEKHLDLSKTLFIVSSKSGGTIELVSLFKYFYAKAREAGKETAGRRFVAITDPGSPLEELAAKSGFRRTFLAPPDVGGRFSALTVFGLVPAALIGLDLDALAASAQKTAAACAAGVPAAQNPALILGVSLAILSEEERNKLTLLSSKGLESFGDWAEQLVAESSGKDECGIIPVVNEPIGELEEYGTDRFFVALVRKGETDVRLLTGLERLREAGHPMLTLRLDRTEDLAGHFFLWECATAVACALLKINAFDQPDVQAAKDRTKALLKSIDEGGEVTLREPASEFTEFFKGIQEGDYVSVLAFLPDRPELRRKLETLCQFIRRQTRCAVTLGFGPRYLHSTGQLHKGGPNTGVFLILTAPPAHDLAVPGEKYTFGQLELAQAMGDFDALLGRDRRVTHARAGGANEKELDDLLDLIQGARQTA